MTVPMTPSPINSRHRAALIFETVYPTALSAPIFLISLSILLFTVKTIMIRQMTMMITARDVMKADIICRALT